MLARDTTYGDALFFPFLSIVVIIVVNQWTGNSTGFLSKEVGCNSSLSFSTCSINLIKINFYLDMIIRLLLGQKNNRLHMPGDVAMNVNGKAELIMIKSVIPNKSTD